MDIVEKLEIAFAVPVTKIVRPWRLFREAASEIRRLRAEVARLEQAGLQLAQEINATQSDKTKRRK